MLTDIDHLCSIAATVVSHNTLGGVLGVWRYVSRNGHLDLHKLQRDTDPYCKEKFSYGPK